MSPSTEGPLTVAESRFLSVVIDCADPGLLALFWQKIVGGRVDGRTESREWVSLVDVPVLGYLSFQRVPEAKSAKNRVHLDLDTDDMDRSVAFAVANGAVPCGGQVEEPTNWFQVMQDPEGNEFCFILRKNRGG